MRDRSSSIRCRKGCRSKGAGHLVTRRCLMEVEWEHLHGSWRTAADVDPTAKRRRLFGDLTHEGTAPQSCRSEEAICGRTRGLVIAVEICVVFSIVLDIYIYGLQAQGNRMCLREK